MEFLSGLRHPRIRLATTVLPFQDLPSPARLRFSLVGNNGVVYKAAVAVGDTVQAGQPLASHDGIPRVISPVSGTVERITPAPDIRGNRQGDTVIITPDASSSPKAFEGLDPAVAPIEALWERMATAGIITNALSPRPLADVIGPGSDAPVKVLIINAADRDPAVCSAAATLKEQGARIGQAAVMLGRMSKTDTVVLAAPSFAKADADTAVAGTSVSVTTVGDRYPASLEPMLALGYGGGADVKVVNVETAVAALEAVCNGEVQHSKAVTFVGPEGTAIGLWRVPIGACLMDIFAATDLGIDEGDKVMAGGSMRGVAQYSLEAAVDAGVDAVTLIPAAKVVRYTNEPCISCGACIKACPVNLQPQFLGRYAEYSLFDNTEDYHVFSCIECGLCATVCPAHRPLLQWIRLAKHEVLAKKAAAALQAEIDATEQAGEGE